MTQLIINASDIGFKTAAEIAAELAYYQTTEPRYSAKELLPGVKAVLTGNSYYYELDQAGTDLIHYLPKDNCIQMIIER